MLWLRPLQPGRLKLIIYSGHTQTSPPVGTEREPGQALAAEGAGGVVAAPVAAHALLRALVHVRASTTLHRGPVARLAHALE